MAPFYEEICTNLGWKLDQSLLDKMKAANEEKYKEIDSSIEDAEKNLGDTEVRDFMHKKAEYMSKIGAKVNLKAEFSCNKYNKQTMIITNTFCICCY